MSAERGDPARDFNFDGWRREDAEYCALDEDEYQKEWVRQECERAKTQRIESCGPEGAASDGDKVDDVDEEEDGSLAAPAETVSKWTIASNLSLTLHKV